MLGTAHGKYRVRRLDAIADAPDIRALRTYLAAEMGHHPGHPLFERMVAALPYATHLALEAPDQGAVGYLEAFRFEDAIADPAGEFYRELWDDGALAPYATARDIVHVRSMYIVPDQRARGRLLQRLIMSGVRHFQEDGARFATMGVMDGMTHLLALYAKFSATEVAALTDVCRRRGIPGRVLIMPVPAIAAVFRPRRSAAAPSRR
jgi:hypothetical protein